MKKMSPIDLTIGFIIGMAAGVIFRGAMDDAAQAFADKVADAVAPPMDEGEDLAAWGGAYPRIDTTAADKAAPTPSRR